MKKYLLVFLAVTSLCGADLPKSPPPPKDKPPRYQHILDNDNKILATYDTEAKEFDYRVNPREVVTLLYSRYWVMVAQCQEAINKLTPKPAPLKKK